MRHKDKIESSTAVKCTACGRRAAVALFGAAGCRVESCGHLESYQPRQKNQKKPENTDDN